MSSLRIHISGQVDEAECRFDRAGVPVVQLELRDSTTRQTVRVRNRYPDNTNTSGHMARALCARVRGQHIEFLALNPRFKGSRIECDADLITTQNTATRKDLA